MELALLLIQSLTLIATLIVVICYTIETAKMAHATQAQTIASSKSLDLMQQMREAETRPYIVPTLDLSPQGLSTLVIENVGKTPAVDIQIEFDPSLPEDAPNNKATQAIKALQSQGFKYMPPGFQGRFFWGVGKESPLGNEFTIGITYYSSLNHTQYRERYFISMDDYLHILLHGRQPLHEISYYLETLSKTMSSPIASALEKIAEAAPEKESVCTRRNCPRRRNDMNPKLKRLKLKQDRERLLQMARKLGWVESSSSHSSE